MVQEFGQIVFPKLCETGGAMSCCVRTCGDEDIAAVPEATNLTFHNAELGRVSFIVG